MAYTLTASDQSLVENALSGGREIAETYAEGFVEYARECDDVVADESRSERDHGRARDGAEQMRALADEIRRRLGA